MEQQGLPVGGLVAQVPCGWSVSEVKGPGGEVAVLVRIESTNGSFMFPMPPDVAQKVGADMARIGRQAESGLIVPQIDLSKFKANGHG